MKPTRRHVSRAIAGKVIALSVGYQRDDLLARGLGIDHLRELLERIARPLVRQAASLAFGGHWTESDDNFTYDLLRLISAEQDDESQAGDQEGQPVGRLISHAPWPRHLEIVPAIEARWINCCRIIRVTQDHAGLASADQVLPGQEKDPARAERVLFNAAVTLTAMRRLMMSGMSVVVPDAGSEFVPPPVARVVMGGKLTGYSGFLPGVFEEALFTLDLNCPLFVLGGLGGASEVLARAFLAAGNGRSEEFSAEWHQAHTPEVAQLARLAQKFALPPQAHTTPQALDRLHELIVPARQNLSGILRTGLSDPETRELMTTRDVPRAVQLVSRGLTGLLGLEALPA